MKKQLECVVLLRGNFVVVPLLTEQKGQLTTMLHDVIKKSNEDPTLFLRWGEDITILAKEVVGWYFRLPVESTADKLLKYIDKGSPGDEWKDQS